MKSKRSAFRFPIPRHKVKYKTAYEKGEAFLLNISTDGCALESPSVPLSVGEKVLITIEDDNSEECIEARALVTRIDNDILGINFTLIEPSTQALIRKYFSQKYRKS